MKNSPISPPSLATTLLRACTDYDEEFDIVDTFKELYCYKYMHSGKRRADFWYWRQVLCSIPGRQCSRMLWEIVMWKNYLKIALRNFYKHTSFSAINISGLSIGMACCMLIMLWVQDELNFEKFNKNIDDIFCVVHYPPDNPTSSGASVPAPLIPYLKDKYADIRHAARFKSSGRRLFSYEGNNVYEDNGGFADPELFDIFSFKAALGDPDGALRDPNAIILTRSMADRYFGSADPLGKTLKLEGQYVFSVAAIIEDIPMSSSIHFDYLIPFENFGLFDRVEMDNWGRYENYNGFVILHDNVDHTTFSEKISDEIIDNNPGSTNKLRLYPYRNLRLFGLNNDGTLKSVLAFAALAILILLIACINFVNLTTAQSGKRAKEIGLRKVIGANQLSIRRQIYFELAAIVTTAFILAVVLVHLLLPKLNALSGKALTLSLSENFGLLLLMLAIAFVTLIISGIYPALYLSTFSPVIVMKSTKSTGSGHSSLRKMLVIAQFTISIALIVSVIVITRQMIYIQNKDLGFDKDHLLYVDFLGNLKTRFDTVKNELLRNPSINSVTVAQSLPNFAGNVAGGLDWEGRPADVRGSMNFVSVEKDYFDTVGIEFLAGETFTTIPDNMLLREFIINEKAIAALKIEHPVGKSFKMWDRDPGRIIGIVKNVHNTSLHQEIKPAFYVQFPYFYNYLIINIKNENLHTSIGFIRDVCEKLNPDYPFEFHFLDENIDRFYQTERQTSIIITYFTIIAVFISCLGLFGLSLFMAEQRIKEIGIRKTLGATVTNIVGMMSKDFLLLVAVANCLSWPVAYFIMRKWLENFAYRVNLGVGIFLLAGLAALGIALMTVSYQSVKAARANPLDSIRYE